MMFNPGDVVEHQQFGLGNVVHGDILGGYVAVRFRDKTDGHDFFGEIVGIPQGTINGWYCLPQTLKLVVLSRVLSYEEML